MRNGARRRAGRAVLALLAGLVAGGWVGGGLVYVFNRTTLQQAAGRVADVNLVPADELAGVPADAAGFVHVRAADLWKTEAMAEYRRLIGKAGDGALKALDDGFAPAPSTLDRVTVVALARPLPPAAVQKGPINPTPEELAALAKAGKKFVAPPQPPPPRREVDVVGLLTFKEPFDLGKVREANLPKAQKLAAGDAELWADADAGVALAARGDRTLLVGPVAGVRAFLLKAKTPDGPLAPALKLAATGRRHVVGAMNLRAYPVPEELTKMLPPELGPVFRADALTVGAVVGRGMRLDLRAGYKDDEAAAEAEKALRKSAEAGRKSLAEAKKKLTEAVAGKDGGPRPRPVADLPEALGGLFALGAIGMLDEWLADPPLERTGPELSAAVTVDSVGGAYATTAAVSVGLLLPAVQKVREAAGRAVDMNNLKQLALAMHVHQDVYNKLPAAGLTSPPHTPRGRPLLSWRVAILPYIEQQALYQQFKLNEPWDSPANIKLLDKMPKVFAGPRGDNPPGKTHYQVFVTPDDAPVRTMFGRTVGRSLLVPDGTSNTIMIAEAAEPVEWTRPQDIDYEFEGELPRLGLPGAAGFYAALGDGSVRFFPHATRPQTLHLWIGANDGMVIPNE